MTRPPLPESTANRGARPDRGATAAEYAVVASLIAVVIVGAVTALGLAVQGLFVFPVGL